MLVTILLVLPSSSGTFLFSNYDYIHRLMYTRRQRVAQGLCCRYFISMDFFEVQVAMADRANAYREYQDLLEAYSLKQSNLYVLVNFRMGFMP